MSAAFYKDKMALMLRTIIGVVNKRVQTWKTQPKIDLTVELSDMIAEAELASVFG